MAMLIMALEGDGCEDRGQGGAEGAGGPTRGTEEGGRQLFATRSWSRFTTRVSALQSYSDAFPGLSVARFIEASDSGSSLKRWEMLLTW